MPGAAHHRYRLPSRKLSKREREVAMLVAACMTNKEIATRLSITESTVKNYNVRIFGKLGVRSRIEVARHVWEAACDSSLC